METAENLRERRRRQNDFSAELAQKGWFHSFELPDGSAISGCMSLEWQRQRWARFPIPDRLEGRRVLDIGAWDGWFSFEAERRGAQVTSVDCVEIANYHEMHRRLGSHAEYRNLDLFDLPSAKLGRFDIVFCLGVLYHVKHPLLALEIVCGLATEVALIETFVIDGPEWREHCGAIPTLEFYETNELNGQFDCWFGPSVGALMGMCRAAGFARVELIAVDRDNALVAAWRKWPAEPEQPRVDAPELIAAANVNTYGINFSSGRDDYVTCWFRAAADSLSREELMLEIGGYGAPAVDLRREADALRATFRIPPGAEKGWNTVRLRLAESRFGAPLRIAIDMPPRSEHILLKDVYDSHTWKRAEIEGTHTTFWAHGLAENCDRHNVRVSIGETRLAVTWIGEPDGEGWRQVNAALPADRPRGERPLAVECGGAKSPTVPVKVI